MPQSYTGKKIKGNGVEEVLWALLLTQTTNTHAKRDRQSILMEKEMVLLKTINSPDRVLETEKWSIYSNRFGGENSHEFSLWPKINSLLIIKFIF